MTEQSETIVISEVEEDTIRELSCDEIDEVAGGLPYLIPLPPY